MTDTTAVDPYGKAVRDALAKLAADTHYDMRRVARETRVPYRTVNRYLTVDGKDQKVPPLTFAVQFLKLLADDPHVIEVQSAGQFLDSVLGELNG